MHVWAACLTLCSSLLSAVFQQEGPLRATAIYRYGYDLDAPAYTETPGAQAPMRFPDDGTCFATKFGIVTCAHVVKSIGDEVELEGGGKGSVAKLRFGPADDLAVCGVYGSSLEELTLSSVEPAVGDELLWIGTNDDWKEESAPVTVLRLSPQWIYTTWPGKQMAPGDSGGPLLNANGQVVGVLCALARNKTYAKFQGLRTLTNFLSR